MKCEKCGSLLSENDEFCKVCGATVNAQAQVLQGGVQEQPMTNQQVMIPEQPMTNQPTMMPEQSMTNQPTMMPEQPTINQPVMQQPMSNQPVMQQPMNNQPVMAQQKNSGGAVKYLVIGIVLIVAIFGGLFIFTSMQNKESTNSNNEAENAVATNSTKSYKVNFKGFTFAIPDNLVYEQNDKVLLIGDEEDTWVAQIEVEEGSFAKLKQNKLQLPSVMQQSGYTCSSAVVKELGGVEYITMEISYSGKKAIAALAKANSMYFIGVTAANSDNEFDYNLLKMVAPIIKSAEVTPATNNISSDIKLDVNAFDELAK